MTCPDKATSSTVENGDFCYLNKYKYLACPIDGQIQVKNTKQQLHTQ